jgi:hypothetical protein
VTDVAYIVRPGDDNEELRHSLRSLVNLPHHRVWVAGHKPAWLTNVEHVPTNQDRPTRAKHANAMTNLRALLERVGDMFVLFNDDFYVTQPLDAVPVQHLGPMRLVLAEYRRKYPVNGGYTEAMAQTFAWLRSIGVADPLCYEMHAPITIDRDTMRDVIQRAERDGLDVDRFHNRTAYGNLAGIGGEQCEDVKVYTTLRVPIPIPFVSTNDTSFTTGAIGRTLRAMYPEPSRYETP